MQTSIGRTLAALNATNEAILYAKAPEELYQGLCEAALACGNFMAAAVFLLDGETNRLRFAAGLGEDVARLRAVDISVVADTPEGNGVCGEAFRNREPCVSNDYLNDPRSLAWRDGVRDASVGAEAALPLICNGRSIGAFLVTTQKAGSLDETVVSLLARMAANVSFGLDNLDQDALRRSSERATLRLNQMFATVSATNEAILRAKTEHDLYQRVCDAAVHSGNSFTAAVLLVDPDTHWLEPVAGTGDILELVTQTRFSIDPDNVYGTGIWGQAFRTQQPCVDHDILESAELPQPAGQDASGMACVALPLTKLGKSVGVLMFFVRKSWAGDDKIVALLARFAENISVALDNFEHASKRAKADEQKERLSRMFAALSATNEAIMRAKSRTELFDLVCDAAVLGGQFTSTTIALACPDSDFLENVASAGNDRQRAFKVRLSTNAARPEGQSLTGAAFRTGKPGISNDYLADFGKSSHFYAAIRATDTRSGAVFPLLKEGKSIGVIIFLASEIGAFSPELIELLQRLAENVSFALENFDRAEEKARADEQKERLSRMFATLSETNEAIMRAKSRAELYEFVCLASASGGRFTSTKIALVRSDSDYMEIVAAAGPTGDTAREVRLSINEDHPEGRGLCGRAYRSGRACIANDYLADSSSQAFHGNAVTTGGHAAAAFPLLSHDAVVGIIFFVAVEKNTFTPEFAELLQRLADNVSFALENFDRADEKQKADERIEYLASHDSLTGIPNREMFNGLLRETIQASSESKFEFALLFIDLDRFKVINDSLGHDAGDMLLIETAKRLRACVRAEDVIARLGGDEFVVLLKEVGDRRNVERIATDVLSALGQPLQLGGHECLTTASIGIAMYPADGSDAQTLTKNADMAMYLAKEDGKNGFRFFSKEVKAQSIERLTLESALRRALEREQFSLQYQPKVDMASGQITGVEALLRWIHPDFGPIPPAQFIPLAEETGVIVPIGRWVLKEACAQNMAWQRRGLRPVTMAVNLSPRQFADKHLLHDVDEALLASGMSPVLLQLEVTESMVMRNVARAIRVLDAIQNRGIRLAIDDFGTGYSSMSLMKQFPIDTIKIDRSFVRDLPTDTEDQAIAQAIISMGKALGMTVIAEGVETVEQQEFLRAHACDEIQGYLFSKPLPANEMAELLRSPLVSPPLQPEDTPDIEDMSVQSRWKRAVV